MTPERLSWDTDFFGLTIGRIHLSSRAESEHFHHADKGDFALIYIYSPVPLKETQQLLFVDEKRTYATQSWKNLPTQSSLPTELTTITPTLAALSIQSGTHSRFHKDPILRPKCAAMYEAWIANSVNHTLADAVLGIEKEGELAGMVTLANKGDVGQIGLIAVGEHFRKQGIGTALMGAAHRWYEAQGLRAAEVVTQGVNAPACRLYESAGYAIKDTTYVYHWARER